VSRVPEDPKASPAAPSVLAGLADAPWPASVARAEFPELDSTNEEARRRADNGDPGPVWIRADRQTAGRGRRGRAWDSPTGNLMATLLLRPNTAPGTAAQLSFVAALSVWDVLAGGLGPDGGPERVRLKWPNDALIDGKKAAGILLESAADPERGRIAWVAIGIGVNLAVYPEDTPYPATSLMAAGAALTPDKALVRLAAAFEHWRGVWAEGEGFSAIRNAWLARAKGLGEAITVRLSNETLEGRFDGLDETGALVLASKSGTRRISAGEVFFASMPPGAGPAQ